MSGRYLIDTNIVIALWANEATVRHELAAVDEVFRLSYWANSTMGRGNRRGQLRISHGLTILQREVVFWSVI
jgi:predicted nucleic acid-binding protein